MNTEKNNQTDTFTKNGISGTELILQFAIAFVLIVNLIWFIFHLVLKVGIIVHFLNDWLPILMVSYGWVDKNFVFIDFVFIGIFSVEFFYKWIYAIKHKIYHRWFFYPILKWYETLNCFPSVFGWWIIWLRVLTLSYRLHKLRIFDFTRNYFYRVVNKYWSILIEEVSDRVVVNVIEGIQSELSTGSPVLHQIIEKVLYPQKDLIAKAIIKNIQISIHEISDNYEQNIREYVAQNIDDATKQSSEFNQIVKVPIVGGVLESKLQKIITEIVTNVLIQVISDLKKHENTAKYEHFTAQFMEKAVNEISEEMNTQIGNLLVEALEIIKQYVKIQQWKVKENAEKQTLAMKRKLKEEKYKA